MGVYFGDVDLEQYRAAISAFAQAREWERFHTPKNLAAALAVEAGELLELFQWHEVNEDVAFAASAEGAQRIREEVADVLIYLIRFADIAGVDLSLALDEKLATNAARYPIDLSRGSAKKHDQLGT